MENYILIGILNEIFLPIVFLYFRKLYILCHPEQPPNFILLTWKCFYKMLLILQCLTERFFFLAENPKLGQIHSYSFYVEKS